jgi:hypothetical protein
VWSGSAEKKEEIRLNQEELGGFNWKETPTLNSNLVLFLHRFVNLLFVVTLDVILVSLMIDPLSIHQLIKVNSK